MTATEPPAGNSQRHSPRLHPLLYDLVRGAIRFLFLTLSHPRVAGLEHCPPQGPAILAVNHLSYFDGPMVLAMFHRRVRPMAADRLRRHFFFGPVMKATGAIFIRRGQLDRAAMRALLEVLAEGGCVAVAIEGTRSPDGRLREGKNGVAYLAAKSGAPLIPAALWGTEQIWPAWRRLRRAEVHLSLGPPVAPASQSLDVSTLDETTRVIMSRIAALLPARYLPETGPEGQDSPGGAKVTD
ncbi:MAG TPA: lysophospholipid acyltransferase family protein [Thermoanaerobaculia bacterium]|nr:lysophospholipid acyltransferase family protein [Thermoanaerobaculia bacterium]